ncbi:tetratricopeptide repeat protein [Ekhidna sp.]
MRILITLFLGYSFLNAFSQSSIESQEFAGLTTFENFQERKYQSVISDLKTKERLSKDEEILLNLSQLKTGKSDAKSSEQWLANNPQHPMKSLVHYHLGEYYFYNQDTLKSNKYLSTISSGDLTKKDRASYGYIYGLLKLNENKYSDASNLFQLARRSESEELNKLDYYQGYSSYHLNQKDKALGYFQNIEDDFQFANSSKFFIAKIHLENGKIDEVLAMAQNELSEEKTITNSGFNQIIGEAYALKNQSAKADAFFQRAIEVHPGKPSAALYYQAGVSKFKIGNEELAIEYLTESGIQGGEYAQLSAFQLGRLYLKKQEYQKSLTAYIEASASNDNEILKESLFQAASINAKLGIYDQAISFADDYLKKFHDGVDSEKMQNLIAQSYLRTSNFDLAIDHLNRLGISNDTQQYIYQQVTYQKAILAFNDASFSEARKWFNESLRFNIDADLTNSSYYHLGEISMQEGKFNQAINAYKKQSNIDAISNYGIGYAYYNKQKYQDAIPFFKQARTSAKVEIRNDASIRHADCLYATKSYQESLDIYNQLSKSIQSSYILYQRGLVLKSLDRTNEAIRSFNEIPTDDRFKASAIFQSAMIEFEAANFTDADAYFTQVIDKYPNSTQYDQSKLNRGISKKNLGQLNDAKSDYEDILKNRMNSEFAFNAILGLQELEQSGLEIKKLDQYIKDYRQAHPDDGSLEVIEFESAKNLYFDFNYLQAAQAFEKYLKNYQSSSNRTEAKYYMADSYYRIDELEKSKTGFDDLKFLRSELTGRILNRLGEINRRLELFKESEEVYKLLVSLQITPKDTYNGLNGLMQLFYENNDFEQAIESADNILTAEWKPINASQYAISVKAKSLYRIDEKERAQKNFKLLENEEGIIGAEANYYLGRISYEDGNYDNSLDLLFDLNAKYGSYTEWVDKSYYLIAENYIAKEELFQAKATLRSIIQHSKNEQVVLNSKNLLLTIEDPKIQEDSTQIKD